jgi:Predicted transcriptional regulators
METYIKIGDFVKLTGSTLKTVLYYHKIGLLPEPQRSPGGYRLYGPAELNRLRLIKHFKSLGLDLQRIKEMIGELDNPRNLQEVLQSMQTELLNEMKTLQERLTKIDSMLERENVDMDRDINNSAHFQMLTEVLGQDKMAEYERSNPRLFKQHRKLHGVLDDFQWGDDYKDSFRALAEYFKDHPQQYATSLNFGTRLARLDELSEDDPEVEALARESVRFIKSVPELAKLLSQWPGIDNPLESLYDDMAAGILSPARMRHKQLMQEYLNSKQDDLG